MLVAFPDAYRPPQSPFYQLPPKVQHYPSSQLLLSPTPPGLQQLLGELIKVQCVLAAIIVVGVIIQGYIIILIIVIMC